MKICKTNYKINSKANCKYTLIADLHGQFNTSIAEYIQKQSNEYIIVAGDIFNGKNWEKKEKVNKFKKFLDIIKKNHKVIISLGNHDLWNITDEGFKNFKSLKDDNIYPIFNETIIIDNNSFTSFVPDKTCYNYLKQERKETIRKIVEEFKKIELPDKKYIRHLVSHNPMHFYHNEIVDLIKDKFDVIETGHLHDGWTPTNYLIKNYDKILDKGFREVVNNVILRKNPYKLTIKHKRILERGTIYMYKDGYHVLLPNNKVYYFNKKDFTYKLSDAKEINNKVPALIVTGALNTFKKIKLFYPSITNFELTKDKVFESSITIKD